MHKTNIIIEENIITVEEQLRVASINLMHNPVKFEERIELFKKNIEELQPDILCLQEVQTNAKSSIIDFLKEELGYTYAHVGTDVQDKYSEARFANAILTNIENVDFKNMPLGISGTGHQYASAVIANFKKNNKDVHVMSVHLAWGGENEHLRLHQANIIAREADRLTARGEHPIVVIGGDFNCEPDSETMRYLYGKEVGTVHKGTYWVDAWKLHGNTSNSVTNDPQMPLGKLTARRVGIPFPSLIPKRRIDYILVHGWAHGRQGSPLNFKRWADAEDYKTLTVSDHYGVASDIYIPKENNV